MPSSRYQTGWRSTRWIECHNNSGEEIPAFAVMMSTGADSGAVQEVDQPDTDGMTKNVFVNGPTPIPTGGYGICTMDWPQYVLYKDSDGTPANGEMWGTEAGTWKISKGKAGFHIVGGNVSGRVWAIGCCSAETTTSTSTTTTTTSTTTTTTTSTTTTSTTSTTTTSTTTTSTTTCGPTGGPCIIVVVDIDVYCCGNDVCYTIEKKRIRLPAGACVDNVQTCPP